MQKFKTLRVEFILSEFSIAYRRRNIKNQYEIYTHYHTRKKIREKK